MYIAYISINGHITHYYIETETTRGWFVTMAFSDEMEKNSNKMNVP